MVRPPGDAVPGDDDNLQSVVAPCATVSENGVPDARRVPLTKIESADCVSLAVAVIVTEDSETPTTV